MMYPDYLPTLIELKTVGKGQAEAAIIPTPCPGCPLVKTGNLG